MLIASGTAIGWGAARFGVGIPDAQGVLHGCYLLHGKNAGLVRLLPATDGCPAGQRAIKWSQTGPAGPAGARGPVGATGAQGPTGGAGAPGSSAALGLTVRSSGTDPSVSCPTGDVAVGGGVDAVLGAGPAVYIRETAPVMTGSVPTGWTAVPSGGGVTVYVVCAR